MHLPIDSVRASARQHVIASRVAPVLVFVLLLATAFSVGFRTTRGLNWPGADWGGVGIDLYRDISSAQTILNEGYGPDPTYRGERNWYNPLTPSVSAVVSRLSGAPVHVVVTRLGTYANLLAPLTLFLMCAALWDRWTAASAVAGFLFLSPNELPSYLAATYSPWFLPVNFVQAIFYLAVLAFWYACRRNRPWGFVIVGLSWGALLLGHTAPALMFGGMVVIWAVMEGRARTRMTNGLTSGTVLLRFGTMVAVALLVSSPFVALILGHYHLHIQNTEPTAFSAYLLSRGLPDLVLIHLTVPMAVAALGFRTVIRAPDTLSRRLLLSWMGVAAVFLVYSFARLGAQLAEVVLPSIVPSFHFFFYLEAAGAVCFGIGLMTISRWVAARAALVGVGSMPVRIAVTSVLLIGLLVGAGFRRYLGRPDFFPARLDGRIAADSDSTRVAEWFRANAQPEDVVLASDKDGITSVAVAGIKTVAVHGTFSNPYVALEPRRRARDAMLVALGRGDQATYVALARQYQVTYVLAHTVARIPSSMPDGLKPVFTSGPLAVYRIP